MPNVPIIPARQSFWGRWTWCVRRQPFVKIIEVAEPLAIIGRYLNSVHSPVCDRKTTMFRIHVPVICLLLIAASNLPADIVIDDFTDATNDRFTNDASFIGSGVDFSGVGRGDGLIDGGTGDEVPTQVRWGTLLSRNVIITANHFPASGTNPNRSQTISFFRNNNSNDEVVRSIVSGQRLGNSDLYVSVLNAPVPTDVNVYSFATESISATPYDPDTNPGIFSATTSGGQNYDDTIAYMLGISPTDRPDSETRFDQAVGRNRISGYIENITINGSDNDTLILIKDPRNDPNYVSNESRFSSGDSGAPLFIEENGELVLLGVNSFIATGGPVLSGVAYTGNHTAEINAFIAANAIPEPSSALVLLVGSALLAFRRRRI